jgi:energy-coupling factor transporter ATP-binding protein EcfA2
MITEITYRSFKSLRELSLPLGQVNVFIGANGSGKSNLLEGLGVLGAAAYGRVDDETLLRRGVRPGVPRLYKTAFPGAGQGTETDILFEAKTSTGAVYLVTLWNPIEKPSPAWKFKTERLDRSSGDRIVSRQPAESKKRNPEQGYAALKVVELEPGDAALALMDDLRNYGIYSPNTPTLRGLSQDQQTREPVGLSGGRLPEAIDELISLERSDAGMREVLDEVRELLDWASDFSAAPSLSVPLSPSAARSRLVVQFIDKFMARGRNKLTGYDASEGALYVLFNAVLALHPLTPMCLAVDNLDQALNPLLAQRVVGAICRWTLTRDTGRQWLLTAHNPAVLDALPLQDDRVRLFAVDRDNKGQTRIKRIEVDAELLRRAEEGWTLSRLWMNGILGGVPNV